MAVGFALSLLELDIVGESLGLDVRRFPFDVPSFGDTHDERARLADVVERRLEERDLARGGRLAPIVTVLVGLYAAGASSIAMLGAERERSLCVRAASDGQRGVVATRQGNRVLFESVGDGALLRAVVGLLPSSAAGSGPSATVAITTPSSADDDGELEPESVLGSGRSSQASGGQRSMVEAVLRRPRYGAGYFVVTRRAGYGRDRASASLTWVDTDIGRYVLVPDGGRYLTCSPADFSRIQRQLARLWPTTN